MQVAIHAGAAFTDEGRVLNSLKNNSGTLTGNGVKFFGIRRYNRIFKPVFEQAEIETLDSTSYQNIQGILPSEADTRRVVFSSGRFAGDANAALREGQLYPFAGRRMALLEQIFDDHQVELFMGLRNPGSFIPKLLMSLPEGEREDIVRNTDLSCLSWIGMIEDIQDLAPNVKITLWSNEDTPFIWGDIMRALTGLGEHTALVDEYDLLATLLDETGRNKVDALAQRVGVQDKTVRHENLAQIFEEHAQPDKIEEELDLPGWSSDIVDAFSELYEQDLQRLGAISGVRILRP
ncbi:hypothetical protein RUE5091_02747 [Ruegeria denitrificans]|uniref:Sulfotransferase domain protein n=2 Tax=Ruegeria denitrificans TaxID=1715692 RepID=A0A0P1ILX0_9RHOB|nr:hypothetical protein RUE5091_02747 [Ruegeria denitrificans]